MYVDTSVFGGVFDAEFERASREFFKQARSGRFRAVLSGIVISELENAPPNVFELYRQVASQSEFVDLTQDAETLAKSYILAGVVGRGRLIDATHVAIATVAGCNAIVSWNFRHIVHLEKVALYNAINRIHGYHEKSRYVLRAR